MAIFSRSIFPAARMLLILSSLGGVSYGDFISNGSFEAVPDGSTGATLLPSNWVYVGDSYNTYSNDGSYGLPPGGLGHFAGVTAFDGIRWMGDGNPGSAANGFGQFLATPLTPGTTYEVMAYVRESSNFPQPPSTFEIWLSVDQNSAYSTKLILGQFAPAISNQQDWEQRTLTFVAPVGAETRSLIVFFPTRTPNGFFFSHLGIDVVSLNAVGPNPVPEPGTLVMLAGSGIVSLLVVRCRRKSRS